MPGNEEPEAAQVLARLPVHGRKIRVTLDKGFKEGVYCIHLEYDDLADAKGVPSASKTAMDYASLLRMRLSEFAGYSVGELDDASRHAGPGRRRDLESTFVSFPVEYADARWHDREITERFQLALNRAN